METIINRAVEKYNESHPKKKIVYDAIEDAEPAFLIYENKKDTVFDYVDFSLYSILFSTKYAFLQTLIGDEIVCNLCVCRFRESQLSGEYSVCDCRTIHNDILQRGVFTSPKHQFIAERLFRLLYINKDNKGEEEAIKLLETFI